MTPGNGWRRCGPIQARVMDGAVREIATADGIPAEFYRLTRRHGGDGFERWPIPEEGISWSCAYRRAVDTNPNWEVRA